MSKARVLTAQDRRFLVAEKEAFLVPHQGAAAMPRKAAAADMGRSESFYSRLLNTQEMGCIPDMVDLRRHIMATGNMEPLRVLAHWVGAETKLPEDASPFELLAATVEADDVFTTQLSKDLADGNLDREEARALLAPAASRLAQAQKALDDLRKHAGRRA